LAEGRVRFGVAKRAVLLLAHGTPGNVDEIPEYLRNVVSGRPMPQAVIEEIQHRYSLIGEPKGHSPLTDLTLEQTALLAAELGEPVYVGMRNWRPYIADTVKQMRADGVEEAAVICLAPQNSRTSVGLYRRAMVSNRARRPGLYSRRGIRPKNATRERARISGHG